MFLKTFPTKMVMMLKTPVLELNLNLSGTLTENTLFFISHRVYFCTLLCLPGRSVHMDLLLGLL